MSLRGSALLRAVYAELHLSLGELYSPKALLIAAQKLIAVSEEEYTSKLYQDEVRFSGYYTREVDLMIKNKPWSLLEYEPSSLELEDERIHEQSYSGIHLKRYHNPDRYFHRG